MAATVSLCASDPAVNRPPRRIAVATTGLMLDGFAVLRFTDEAIADDPTGCSPSSKAC
jgi:hypothetical protein